MRLRLQLLTFFILFFSSALSFAAPGPEPSGSILGKLLDQESQSPMDNVTIMIFRGDQKTPAKTASTDQNGVFIFSNIMPGEYRIQVGSLGYLPFEDRIQVLANQQLKLEDIALKTKSKDLAAIEVKGMRSTMKLEVDKRVFTVDQSVAAAGASTSDILKNLPSVEVDAEGSISLRNNSNVVIWINGKPSGLTAENRSQVLEQMPAESIDRIEVITNPSAKYSAEGSAGIINIILKKNRKAGYYGSLRAGVSSPAGTNFGGNINYSSPKWDLSGNIGLRNEKRKGDGSTFRRTDTEQGGSTIREYLNSNTAREFSHNGLFLRAGADYHFNEKHTLGLSGFLMDGSRDMNSTIDYLYRDNQLLPSKTRQRISTENNSNKHSELELDYQWEIGSGHSLHAILSAGGGTSPGTSDFTQNDANVSGMPLSSLRQNGSNDEKEKELEFQLDYSRKFTDRLKLEAGWKSSVENRLSTNAYSNLQSGNWIVFSDNKFDYDEQIHAAYATLTGKISEKLGYQLGLRGENTNIRFTSTDQKTGLEDPHDKNYLKLFPTIFLNYTLSEGTDAQLNYSRRINRPRGRMLNPFVNISDSSNIWVGNPDINPEYTNSLEANLLKTWTNHTLSAALYYRRTEQVIQDIRYLDNGVMKQTPENVTNSVSSGVELVAKDKFLKTLETTTTLNLFNQSMDGFTYRGNSYAGTSGFSWNVRSNGQLSLPWECLAQISAFYSAPRKVAQGDMKGAYSLDFGLRKSLMNRNLQIALNGQNILNSFRFENKTWGPGFYQESSNQFFGRTVRLTVTWNFGNLKPKEKSREKSSNENSGGMDSEY